MPIILTPVSTANWNLTRAAIADIVLRKCGALEAGQEADAGDRAVVYSAMDTRLKALHAIGKLWWKTSAARISLSLSAGVPTATVDAGQNMLFPLSVMVANGSVETEVDVKSLVDYLSINDKTVQGTPNAAYVDGNTIYFYPVPAANMTAKLAFQSIINNSDSGATLDIPTWALHPFINLVKYDVADEFGVPEGVMQRWLLDKTNAERDLRIMKRQQETPDETPVDYF